MTDIEIAIAGFTLGLAVTGAVFFKLAAMLSIRKALWRN